MINIGQLIVAFLVSMAIAGLAYWRHSLSRSGVVGAIFVGSAIIGFGGWSWGVLLAVFFISSSTLSRYKTKEKEVIAEQFDKGHQRDSGQVLANGGWAAILAMLHSFWPAEFWWPMFIGAIATANADTWATELGTLARQAPRFITTGRIVRPGTSGGITLWGTFVSLWGGLLIGLCAGLFSNQLSWVISLAVSVSGLAGSLFDSYLGATAQAIYYADTWEKETEKRWVDGQKTIHIRGWAWMTNDAVNFLATVFGSFCAYGIAFAL